MWMVNWLSLMEIVYCPPGCFMDEYIKDSNIIMVILIMIGMLVS